MIPEVISVLMSWSLSPDGGSPYRDDSPVDDEEPATHPHELGTAGPYWSPGTAGPY